jgi:L-iditol 2-dehydrogenase
VKALVKYRLGDGCMELRDLPDPAPGPGQVSLAVRFAGVCGSDLHIYHNDIAIPIRPPVVTGHEFSGVISAVGDGVEGWKAGDRVVSETAFSYCGTCIHCREGFYNLCDERRTLGYWHDGAFAPQTVVPAARLHRLPESISDLSGAMMEPLACVVHAAIELTRIQAGDIVLVTGPGAIGLMSLQVARACGARVLVCGTAVDAKRLELAAKLGADWTVRAGEQNLPDVVRDLTGGRGVDVALECSGNAGALADAVLAVRKRGSLTQVGLFSRTIPVDFDRICYKEIKVTGSLASRWASWDRAIRLAEGKSVLLEPLASDVLPLSQWKRAFDLFEGRQGVKIILDPRA